MSNTNKLSIIIPGHDSYKDIVNLYMSLLNKNWVDCRYNIYWSNCVEKSDYENLNVINNGNDATFSRRLLNALINIETKYVLMNVEDFLYTKVINSEEIEDILNIMEKSNYIFCKLSPDNNYKRDRDNANDYTYHSRNDRPYGLCINSGVFNREYLISIIPNENWNAWELENYWLKLAKEGKCNGCIYDDRDVLNLVHLIEKGKMIPSSIKIISSLGIDIAFINRPIQTKKEVYRSKLISIFGEKCPNKIRVVIKKILNKSGIRTTTKY